MISLIDYIKEQLILEHGGVVPTLHNLAKEISKQLENEIEKSDSGSFVYHYTDAKENELGAFGKNVDIYIDFNINRNANNTDIGATYETNSLKLINDTIDFTLTININKEIQHNKLRTKLVHELTHAVTNINEIHNFINKTLNYKDNQNINIDLSQVEFGMRYNQTGSYKLFVWLNDNIGFTSVYMYYFLNNYEQNAYIGELEEVLKTYIIDNNINYENIKNITIDHLLETSEFKIYGILLNRFYSKKRLIQTSFSTNDLKWYKRAAAADKAPKELNGEDLYKYAIEHEDDISEEQLKKKLNTLFMKFDKQLRTSFIKTLFKILSEEYEKNN